MKHSTCPRCGMVFNRISKQHRQLCRDLPLPTELAEDFLKSNLSFNKWSEGYPSSVTMLRPRVIHGLRLLGRDVRTAFEQQSKKRPKRPMTACPRCGVAFRNLTDRHRRLCQELPLPVELAENFLGEEVSFNHWANEYNVAITTLRDRLAHGLEALGHNVDEVIASKRKWKSQTAALTVRQRQDAGWKLCSGCTMMLKPEQVEAGLCEFCSGEAFDYMEAVINEYEYPAGGTAFTAVLNTGGD